MTSFRPSLRLSRLVVTKGREAVFDEHFHVGVNIIHGENGSGKSTIADFIFYVLGGDLTHWKQAALQCDFVTAEVILNGDPVTLRRRVEGSPQQPMELFLGPYDQAVAEDRTQWERYPFRRSSNKESFTQIVFRMLGLPDAPGDEGANITMHQILRLIYADQMSPVDKMFRFESYDPRLTRETVGDFLCGVYDPELYSEQLVLREWQKKLDGVTAELKSFFRLLGDEANSLDSAWVQREIQKYENAKVAIQDEIHEIKERRGKGAPKEASFERQEEMLGLLTKVRGEIEQAELGLAALEFELEDSAAFIEHLKGNLRALEQSETTQEVLGGITYEYCPACFAPIEQSNADACGLCKTPRDVARTRSNIHKMRQELTFQLRESQALQNGRAGERRDSQKRLEDLYVRRKKLSDKYLSEADVISSKDEAELEDLNQSLGYIDRQIDDLLERMQLIGRVTDLQDMQAGLIASIEHTKASIESRKLTQEVRRVAAYREIEALTLANIRKDLERESQFTEAGSVQFSFADDKIYVDGESIFSASSMVILKNSFHLALFEASISRDFFRFPRFSLFDNIEDKGMEPSRSHNFQRLVVGSSQNATVDHQVIMTTSMIAPELEVTDYVVGRRLTHEDRALRLM